jgi:CAAX prenyl protease-like protein
MANKNVSSAANAPVIPFIVFIVFMMLEKVLHGATLPVIAQQFDLRWLYALRVGVVVATLAYFWRHYIELKRPTQVPLSQWMAAIAVGVGVFILWINLDQPWARMGESQGFNPLQPDGSLNIGIVAFRLAGSALVVPVMEELFWRSFILRWSRSLI